MLVKQIYIGLCRQQLVVDLRLEELDPGHHASGNATQAVHRLWKREVRDDEHPAGLQRGQNVPRYPVDVSALVHRYVYEREIELGLGFKLLECALSQAPAIR